MAAKQSAKSVPDPGASAAAKLSGSARAKTVRAYRLLMLVLVLRPFGNLSLAWGMRHFSQVLSANPFTYVTAFLNPYVALGVAMLACGLLTRMALLSLADLSFVLPLTATGYVLSTLLGRFVLREEVSVERWLGTLLIFLGTAVVGTTSRRMTSNNRVPADDTLLPARE